MSLWQADVLRGCMVFIPIAGMRVQHTARPYIHMPKYLLSSVTGVVTTMGSGNHSRGPRRTHFAHAFRRALSALLSAEEQRVYGDAVVSRMLFKSTFNDLP